MTRAKTMTMRASLVAALLAALPAAVPGCKADSKGELRHDQVAIDQTVSETASERTATRQEESPVAAPAPMALAPPTDRPSPVAPGAARAKAQLDRDGDAKDGEKEDDAKSPLNDKAEKQAVDHRTAGRAHGEAATRAWFPETFLFEPLVVTDEHGDATVPVRVPDRLTTWRVLALAHARTGAQGGAVTSFAGTLPAYVEPITPKTLVVGDVVRLPIQLVNTTSAAITAPLSLAAEGGALTAAGGPRTIPAAGSLVEYATLAVTHAGTVRLVVKLGDADSVVRTIAVVPAGRPITTARSGTLAAPRTLRTAGTPGADPETDHVRLLAFPGALALLRSELGVSTARAGVADDAYALLLAGRAPALLAALGDKADPEALRELTIVTSQRVIRDGRTLDVPTASLLAEAALAHPQNPVLARLGERALAFLQQQQRPDGTFGGGEGWSLQRVLVATADATRATGTAADTVEQRQRAEAIATRAAGAFERNLDRVDDAYTAAAILASGAVRGPAADPLRARVRAGIVPTGDDSGAKILQVAPQTVRADGVAPSPLEATALAVLALSASPAAADKAALADLGATLLGAYSPERGWGDGRANLACMRAVLELFKAPVPADVHITLAMDGAPVAEGTLARDRLRDVLVLDSRGVPATAVTGLARDHVWTVTAEPPVPGLGFSLALQSWVPWGAEPVHGGLELGLPAAVHGAVGQPSELAVTAVAPSGTPLHLTEPLPAGVQVDTPSLDALVTAGTIARYEVADGKVELFVTPLQPGQTFAAKLRVIPTLAGTLHAAAAELEAAGEATHAPPATWTIR